jgi:hypothetical protein
MAKGENTRTSDDSLFGTTAIVFGVLSLLLYVLVIRPRLPTDNATAAASSAVATNGAGVATTTATASVSASTDAGPKASSQRLCTRSPPHLATSPVNNGSNVLSDGLVAFKHTSAALSCVPATTPAAPTNDAHFKARAKALSRLLPGHASQPPAKGSTVVVSISLKENKLDCAKQREVLYLLASYYNLLVILAVDESAEKDFSANNRLEAIAVLRGGSDGGKSEGGDDLNHEPSFHITEQLIPTHRFIVASTVPGRVAFVRQLQRIALVLDFDAAINDLLSRFGHRVVVYGATEDDASVSKLGQVLV